MVSKLALVRSHVLTSIDYMNRNGSNVGSKVMMVVVAVLNSGRNSFSFFLLLIVCMGYGVVKPTLGRTMVHVRWLAGGHFIFGLIYSIASLTITPEHAGKLNCPNLQDIY
jgi:Lung seven transmembrane receptor